MKRFVLCLSFLAYLAGVPLKAQQIIIQLPGSVPEEINNQSYWSWDDGRRCWVWTGPEFEGERGGHDWHWWHEHRFQGDREHPPYAHKHHDEHHDKEHHEHHDRDDHDHDHDGQ